MNDFLLKERLFSLLSEPSQEVTKEEMQNAYGCFIKQVETSKYCKPTVNYTLWVSHLARLLPGQWGETERV
jgi:hypothetical protein